VRFNILPDSKKALQKGFILLLVILAFLGGVLVSNRYYGAATGQKKEEYEASLSILKESIHQKELTHSKEISLLKSEYEKSLKQKIIRETKPDGSSKETIETDTQEKATQEQVVIKEVEVVKYIDRVVEVEKVVEKRAIITNNTNWSLGVSIEPKLSVPYFDSFSLDVGYSLLNNLDVFMSYDNNLKFSEPSYKIGFRVRF
jgi:hypothetical protein